MTEEPEVAPCTRMYEFPGGLFELRSAGDESDNHSGFYLELLVRGALIGLHESEARMTYRPTAVGYLRTDVSGMARLWDQTQIRRLATRLGYDFADLVIFDPQFDRPPLARLKAQATRLDAEAVIVPSSKHFPGGEVPDTLVRQLDVITVDPEETYARRAMPSLRDVPAAEANGS
ncbi:hypothetical protein [Nocardia sp. NPDC056100]|uniref:hypothetical protein n=1 Tax=Nocardia sp. NPDC056100 TaxID=3345712 RepID=UPI0035DEC04A